MNIYKLENDIAVFCVTAKSFPAGILEAHESLTRLVNFSPQRKYFGVSWMDKQGDIIYKAATEELEFGELHKHQLEQFTIRKGNYVYIDVNNFMQHVPEIGKAFDKLKSDNRIDPQGVALEWYLNEKDVRGMIRIL